MSRPLINAVNSKSVVFQVVIAQSVTRHASIQVINIIVFKSANEAIFFIKFEYNRGAAISYNLTYVLHA